MGVGKKHCSVRQKDGRETLSTQASFDGFAYQVQ